MFELTMSDKIFLSKLLYPNVSIREGVYRIERMVMINEANEVIEDISHLKKGFISLARVLLGADYTRILKYVKTKLGFAKEDEKVDIGAISVGLSVYGLYSRFSFIKRTIRSEQLNAGEKGAQIGWYTVLSPKVRIFIENSVDKVASALIKDYKNQKIRYVFAILGYFLGNFVESKLFQIFMKIARKGWNKVEAFIKWLWFKTFGKSEIIARSRLGKKIEGLGSKNRYEEYDEEETGEY